MEFLLRFPDESSFLDGCMSEVHQPVSPSAEGAGSLSRALPSSGLGGGTGAGASALVGTYPPATARHKTSQDWN